MESKSNIASASVTSKNQTEQNQKLDQKKIKRGSTVVGHGKLRFPLHPSSPVSLNRMGQRDALCYFHLGQRLYLLM